MKELPLTRGLVALVDDDVYKWAINYRWFAVGRKGYWYAGRRFIKPGGKQTTRYLHREIFDNPDMWVDHKDRNTLNDLRENLRLATRSQNCLNKQTKERKYPGRYPHVTFVPHTSHTKPWKVVIHVPNGKHIYGGYHETEEGAHEVAVKLSKEIHGDFAHV